MNNPYSLLSDETDNANCTEEINNLLRKFKLGYDKVAKKFPKAGVGDTATDECVADVFYGVIHYNQELE